MKELILEFTGLQLARTCFRHPILEREIKAVRGKTNGAYLDYGSFQWTKAVRAISVLSVKAKLFARADCNLCAIIEGENASLASALDYAMDKQPMWLIDMFGADGSGRSISKRLFNRTNPGRKRYGPTAISWNSKFIPQDAIRIFLNDKELHHILELKNLEQELLSEDTNQALKPFVKFNMPENDPINLVVNL